MADNAPKTGIQNIGDGKYQIPLNKVAGWNRQTIADGMWLNNNTVYPLAWNEMVLASGINYTSAAIDYTSAGLVTASGELDTEIRNSSGFLQEEIDIMKAATDVIMVYGTYADFVANSGELTLTDKDVVKVLHDENSADEDQVYYQCTEDPEGVFDWTKIGALDPYYNTTEIDEFLRWTSADYVRDTVSADLYNKLKTSADTLHQEIDTVSGDLYDKLSTSASTLHQEINTVSSKLQTEVEWTSAALQTSASKLKNEINFTSSWLDKAYAVNGSEFIKVTSGADVFGEQQTFTVDFQDHPLTLSGADEDVQVFESADCALISAYPWKVFYATPNVTSFEEIKAAHEKGLQVVVIEYGRNLFRLTSFNQTSFFFNRIWEDVIDDIVPFEAWECYLSYGHTDWQKLAGDGDLSVPKYLATTEYASGYANDTSAQILQWIQTSASQASANALSEAKSYANNASGNAYTKAEDLIRNCSGKTEVSGSLFIKSSVSRSGDKNIYTEELDTGKFLGTNIRITSGTNGLTFSAKNYTQDINDASAYAYDQAYMDLMTEGSRIENEIPDIEMNRNTLMKQVDKLRFDNVNYTVSAASHGNNYDTDLGFLVKRPSVAEGNNVGDNGKVLTAENGAPKWKDPVVGSRTVDSQSSSQEFKVKSIGITENSNGNVSVEATDVQGSHDEGYLVPEPVANKQLIADSAGVMKWDNAGGIRAVYNEYRVPPLNINDLTFDATDAGRYTEVSANNNSKDLGYLINVAFPTDTSFESSDASYVLSYDPFYKRFGYVLKYNLPEWKRIPGENDPQEGCVLQLRSHTQGGTEVYPEWKSLPNEVVMHKIAYMDHDNNYTDDDGALFNKIEADLDSSKTPMIWMEDPFENRFYFKYDCKNGADRYSPSNRRYSFSLVGDGNRNQMYSMQKVVYNTGILTRNRNVQELLVDLPTSADIGKVVKATAAGYALWSNIAETKFINSTYTFAQVKALIDAGYHVVYNDTSVANYFYYLDTIDSKFISFVEGRYGGTITIFQADNKWVAASWGYRGMEHVGTQNNFQQIINLKEYSDSSWRTVFRFPDAWNNALKYRNYSHADIEINGYTYWDQSSGHLMVSSADYGFDFFVTRAFGPIVGWPNAATHVMYRGADANAFNLKFTIVPSDISASSGYLVLENKKVLGGDVTNNWNNVVYNIRSIRVTKYGPECGYYQSSSAYLN